MHKKYRQGIYPDNWKEELAAKAKTTPDNVLGVSVCKNGIKVITRKPTKNSISY